MKINKDYIREVYEISKSMRISKQAQRRRQFYQKGMHVTVKNIDSDQLTISTEAMEKFLSEKELNE